jgi:ubiquinone/menaquinone biosynthesis C-methylase UbiE
MDIKKTNQELMSFWDNFFHQFEPMTIDPKDVKVENALDQYIKDVGDYASNILDFGSGIGNCIMMASLLGDKMTKGLAIDSSSKAIELLEKTLENSNIKGIETMVGTHKDLATLPKESFDGVLCSNVLDVVPFETSTEMIEEISRLLKPKGLLMVKLNFYLTEDIITRTKAEEISENSYVINGILRSHNLTSEEWVKRFKGFKLLKSDTYDRVKTGPLDRVLLLEKQ